jgi:hypothetical protein
MESSLFGYVVKMCHSMALKHGEAISRQEC